MSTDSSRKASANTRLQWGRRLNTAECVERLLAGTKNRGYTVKFTGEMRA